MDELQASKRHLSEIRKTSKKLSCDITLMEICGGHTNTIMKYGIRDVLPENIRLISGPGCPVCVTPQHDIDSIVGLALSGVAVATYGDMLRVPGSLQSLSQARAQGAKVYDVYSTTEVLEISGKEPDIVFFGVGFETTTPMTAYLLENEKTVYSVHKLIPPAMQALLHGDVKIDGFINPGHVSAVIGAKAYDGIDMPQAIAGFTPERILRAIRFLVSEIAAGRRTVINAYPEAVRDGGNISAQKKIEKHFKKSKSNWRGIGQIKDSGLEVKSPSLDAKKKYKDIISLIPEPKKTACRCSDVLKGAIEPVNCPLYARECTPKNPVGACMVSYEGSCSISYLYGKK
jgi:hydrogenase expression/formation protein HypD